MTSLRKMAGIAALMAISVVYVLVSPMPWAQAASGQPVIDGFLQPAGYTQITSLSSAAGLGSIPDGVKLTLIQAQDNDIRWRDDGTNPTTSVGMVLSAGQTLVYNGNPAAFKAIEVTASAALNVTFYK